MTNQMRSNLSQKIISDPMDVTISRYIKLKYGRLL